MISPKGSQVFGLAVSIVTGLAVFTAVWGFIAWQLDFWYIDEVLAPVVGIILGGLSGYWMFMSRQREVPLNWVGISLYLGKPTGTLYKNGIHWVFPFFGARNVPAREKKFILPMPGEMIDAQDGIAIFFGISDPDHPGKHNRIQYSVLDPMRYIATDDPEDAIKEEYIQAARLFFGQVTKAIGVKNEKLLFGDFLALLPKTVPESQEHAAFRARLKSAMFVTTLQTAAETAAQPRNERLFSDDSVITIMERAGDFLDMAASWGLGDITAFTANVRENPASEAAAAKKTEAVENMATLKTKADQIRALAKQMKDDGVSPDLAVTMVAKISGQDVKIENQTINYSGIPDVIRALGEKAIEAYIKKGVSNV